MGISMIRQVVLAMILKASKTIRRDSLSARIPAGSCAKSPPMVEKTRKIAISDICSPTLIAYIGPTDPNVDVDRPATMTPRAASGDTL